LNEKVSVNLLLALFLTGLIAPVAEMLTSAIIAKMWEAYDIVKNVTKQIGKDTGVINMTVLSSAESLLRRFVAIMLTIETVETIVFAYFHVVESIAYLGGVITSFLYMHQLVEEIATLLGIKENVYLAVAGPILIGLVVKLLILVWYYRQRYSYYSSI